MDHSQPDSQPGSLCSSVLSPRVHKVASLDQRLQNLTVQPTPITELWPMPTRLLVKRSKRCRVCLHNMIKPELAPDSIRYKMQVRFGFDMYSARASCPLGRPCLS